MEEVEEADHCSSDPSEYLSCCSSLDSSSSSVASPSSSWRSYDISERLIIASEYEEIPSFRWMSRSLRWVSRSTTGSSPPHTTAVEHSGPALRFLEDRVHAEERNNNLGKSNNLGNGDQRKRIVFFHDGCNREGPRFDLEDLMHCGLEILDKSSSLGMTSKVTMENGYAMAAKTLRNEAIGCTEDEFYKHMFFISNLCHRKCNLVCLTAFYYSKHEKILFNEYLPNRTLDYHLRRTRKPSLDWRKTIKIVQDAARGLVHIHEEGIPHGNVKPSNVILDANDNACLSDFGITLLLDPDIATSHLGAYRAPELTFNKKLSKEADVYAFGVLLMEILTRRQLLFGEDCGSDSVSAESTINLQKWVQHRKKEMSDKDVEVSTREEEQMIEIGELALACVKEQPHLRPTMHEVVKMIEDISSPTMAELFTCSPIPLFYCNQKLS